MTMIAFYQPLGNCQSQTVAAFFATPSLINTLETVKDMQHVFLRNPLAKVLDANFNGIQVAR